MAVKALAYFCLSGGIEQVLHGVVMGGGKEMG